MKASAGSHLGPLVPRTLVPGQQFPTLAAGHVGGEETARAHSPLRSREPPREEVASWGQNCSVLGEASTNSNNVPPTAFFGRHCQRFRKNRRKTNEALWVKRTLHGRDGALTLNHLRM